MCLEAYLLDSYGESFNFEVFILIGVTFIHLDSANQ